jgi:hypothetical protein
MVDVHTGRAAVRPVVEVDLEFSILEGCQYVGVVHPNVHVLSLHYSEVGFAAPLHRGIAFVLASLVHALSMAGFENFIRCHG